MVSRIDGYSDYESAINGRWTGQPRYAPSYASNQRKGWLVAEGDPAMTAASPYWLELAGTGFGAARGSITVMRDPFRQSPVRATIVSWSDSRIRFRLSTPVGFEGEAVTFVVQNAQGLRGTIGERVMGLLSTRGAGQCTWEVALQRLNSGLRPPPRAFPSSLAIDAKYVPRRNDVIFWGATHTGIITSVPVATVVTGRTSYSFRLTERNAKWNEARSETPATFAVLNGKVVTGIRSIGLSYAATSYWR